LAVKATNPLTMKFLTAIACLVISTAALAQTERDPKAHEKAARQAAEISQMIGLDDTMNQQLTKALMSSSDETAELRAQCDKIKMQVDAVYQKNMDMVIARMEPGQKEKYMAAVKDGRIKMGCCDMGGGSCASGSTKAAGCSEAKAEGKPAGGCCAGGKAHADAAPADQKVAPVKK
jgi:hypothetical protein